MNHRNSRRRLSGTLLARRIVQVVCLLAFLGLLVAAQDRHDGTTSGVWKTFFLIDPLLLVATWLAAHAMPLALFALPALAVAVLALALAGRRVSAMGVLVAAVWIMLAAIVVSAVVGHLGVPSLLLVALGTVVLTALLGRVFCGWVCPLGTLHALASRLLLRPAKPGQDPWSPWQKAKYYLLAGVLVMALLGGHWGTIFDPLVLLYRTTTTALGPATRWAVEEGSTAVVRGEEALEGDTPIGPGQPAGRPWRLSRLTEPAYAFLRDNVFLSWGSAYLGTGLIVGFLLLTLGLNAYRRRFWCRYLCPLGALLGVISWRPLLRRSVVAEQCNGCDLCGRTCHGAAAAEPGQGWMAPECLGCFHCTTACPRTALKFQLAAPWRMPSGSQPVDLSKRAALASALGGLAALAFLRATPQGRGRVFHPRLLRPPGSRDEPAFLARCTACGLCMKVCPTGGLQPAWSEAGLEGLWTPRLVPQIGHCDYTCNLCGQVCPTEAIRPLDIDTKQQTRIGLAAFDTSRCIPYACGRDCGVCEEHCPIPDKAIYYVEVEVQDHDGNKRTIKQPRIDPTRCIGCGQCENVCVYKDRPAVRVFSANETRHPNNQPILGGDDPYAGMS
jgi:polyferredoxin/formate hydrogenlyase subunit 6/NADH:ubiquinone oxidoreductase subunit I